WQAERELHGHWYRQALDQMSMVVAHQWSRGIQRSALRGFFLHGPPGLGKTTLVKRVSYELCRIFEQAPLGGAAVPVRLVLIDGSDLARSRYGETEELLGAHGRGAPRAAVRRRGVALLPAEQPGCARVALLAEQRVLPPRGRAGYEPGDRDAHHQSSRPRRRRGARPLRGGGGARSGPRRPARRAAGQA